MPGRVWSRRPRVPMEMPFSSSTVPATTRWPRRGSRLRLMRAAANTWAARPPLQSAAPRPCRRPPSMRPLNGDSFQVARLPVPTVSMWLASRRVGPSSIPCMTPTALPSWSAKTSSKPTAFIWSMTRAPTLASSPLGLWVRKSSWANPIRSSRSPSSLVRSRSYIGVLHPFFVAVKCLRRPDAPGAQVRLTVKLAIAWALSKAHARVGGWGLASDRGYLPWGEAVWRPDCIAL